MLKFGDRIQFDVRFNRVRHWQGQEDWRIWVLKVVPQATGIVIGRRTIWNGEVDHLDRLGFQFSDSVPAYLVAINMADNPILIPIEGYNKEERLKEDRNNC